MDSLNNQKAVNSHQSKVVSETQNNKASSNQSINTSLKGNQTDLKDTNFEYEDNEWDIGIGDLIIDLDADIEKSSSTNLETALVIPLQSAANLNSERVDSVDSKNQDLAEIKNQTAKTAPKGKNEPTTMSSTANSGTKGASKVSIDHQATLDKGLKMKIKRTKTGTKTSDSKHEIVKSEQNGNLNSDDAASPVVNCKKPVNPIGVPASPSSSANKRGNNSHRKDKGKDKSQTKDKPDMGPSLPDACTCGSDKLGGLPCNSASCSKLRDSTLPPRVATTQNQISLNLEKQSSTGLNTAANAPGPPKESIKLLSQSGGIKQKDPQKVVDFSSKSQSNSSNATSSSYTSSTNSDDGKMSNSPPMKRIKCDSKMVDVCVGTSIGTITEPDHLGPCEPGTSVTLEGIVWHETDGGVLAVNVTWRGKTYVGTLIDCTKHDWAPPRFCDSPTEELESRLPKGGRGKRGRNSVTSTNDLINFTETRSSVHSKLRNGGPKGRASRNSSVSNINISTNAVTNTPSTSPTTFSVPRPEKRRKSKDESPSPFNNGNNSVQSNANNANNSITLPSQGVGAVKKSKNVTSPCAISPVLLECPEQDCSKKYKHANGLKYHQSHAHGIISNADDDSLTAPDSPSQRSQSPPNANLRANDKATLETSFSQKINFESVKVPIIPNDSKPVELSATKSHSVTNTERPTPIDNSALVDSNSSNPFSEATLKPSTTSTPTKQEAQSKNKTNILRFANTSDIEQTSNDSMSDLQSQSSSFYPLPGSNKASSAGKNKKNRKSPGPELDTEVCTINKPVDGPARSPAYSDISDDSNTGTENNLNDKLKVTSDIKKSQEPGNSNPLSIGGYNNMYGPFYQPSPFFQPPENQSTKPLSQQPPNSSGGLDYNKSKEHSPLDLMNKIQPTKNPQNEPPSNSPNPSNPVGKMMQHYQHYPYNFIQPNYPYSMENSFGSVPSSSSEDGKPPGIHIKEELGKELPSPDNLKPGMPSKLIKTEVLKEIKSEPGQSLPSNLSQSPQHMSPYPNMYQRHSIGLPPMSREEEIQKYFIYPDQRRTGPGGTPTNLSSKDERTSQSPTTSHMGNPQSSVGQHGSSFKAAKSSSSSSSSSSVSKSSSSKDIKTEDKEPKVKQEGQKPTMETQGPPPPPTSQYYLPYMGPGGNPFFPDPSHPMYRNMLVPSPAPYNASYHLQMARFSSPEDLSRNPNTKALDLLQQHANQYYNTHKIHELSERHSQLKSPTSNPKIPVTSSPNISQPLPGTNINVTSAPNNTNNTSLSSNTSSMTQSNLTASSSSSLSTSQQPPSKSNDKNDRVDAKDPLSGSNGSLGRGTSSPPTQRHVHTHHHTHVGIGYMSGPIGYPAPYVNPAVLASQQAVINPFTNPPSNK